MLTKRDIKQIRTAVREEVKTQLDPVSKRVDSIAKRVNSIDSRLKKVEKNTKDTVDFLDQENIDLAKRTKRIEQHLDLPQIV
ncbi:hypothetical protein HY029_02820 [Candidatus Gottesmanbacteria bacterium]|nr:hypothetical protein [Candidatus Gottesmanbacteria bacterium]